MKKNYSIRLDEEIYNKVKEKHKNFTLYIRVLIENDLKNQDESYCCEQFLKLKEELNILKERYEKD